MARTLWLLRHAKTVADPPEGGSDFDRVLAPRGRRDAKALADCLAPKGTLPGVGRAPRPTVALVSPAARTAATAELALAHWSRPPAVRLVPDLYGAEPNDVLAALRKLEDDIESVMVVGHNPTAHALSVGLIDQADTKGLTLAAKRGFPTCALGIYTFAIDSWRDAEGHSAKLKGLWIPPFGGE
jgi:phosphohistidine phosphatase